MLSLLLLPLPCLASQSLAQPGTRDNRWCPLTTTPPAIYITHLATTPAPTTPPAIYTTHLAITLAPTTPPANSSTPPATPAPSYFRFLNLITWVKFDNEECAADNGDNGTCYTR